jgi:hypothetical protein
MVEKKKLSNMLIETVPAEPKDSSSASVTMPTDKKTLMSASSE